MICVWREKVWSFGLERENSLADLVTWMARQSDRGKTASQNSNGDASISFVKLSILL